MKPKLLATFKLNKVFNIAARGVVIAGEILNGKVIKENQGAVVVDGVEKTIK